MFHKIIKRYGLILTMLFSIGFVTTTTSCAKKVGCSAENNVGPKTNKDGTLKLKRGSSTLFSKKQRKNRRRGSK